MGTPQPPAPAADPPTPAPTPPADPKAGNGSQPPEGDPATEMAKLQAALSDERKARRDAESKLSRAETQHMTDQEKAIAAAKAEGKSEAVQAAGRKLAAAEFRAAAAGKIADPAAALEVLDLTKYVDEDGEVDGKALAAMVDRLAAALPAPPQQIPGRVPAGVRETAPDSTDFIRARLTGQG